jgi:hypothetical protein
MYFGIAFFLVIEYIAYVFVKGGFVEDVYGDILEQIVASKTLVIFINLMCVGIVLLKLMKEKYNFAYKSQKKSIQAFLCTELFGLLLLSITRFLGFYYGDNVEGYYILHVGIFYNFSGLRTII